MVPCLQNRGQLKDPMNQKIQNIGKKSQSGFSLIEILVATVLVLILSATSYRVLTKQGSAQRVSVLGQKQNDSLIKALDRFKEDISKIDPVWPKSGVASVYPHPGFGLQKNFYTNTYIRDEGLNDAVTFIHRDIEKSEIYSLKTKLDSSPTSLSAKVYDDWIQLNETTIEIENGDMVLIYQPGKYVLGIVTHVQTSPLVKIKIRMPNEDEAQETKDNVWNRSSGFVTQTGIVPASYDWNQKNTADTTDNSIVFDKYVTKVQVVQAVTYELDWATKDNKARKSSPDEMQTVLSVSAFVLDKDGNRKKMLYRTSYANGAITREPMAETNQLGFTYDILKSAYGGTNDFTGYTDGDLERDVGRENNTSIQLVNFNVDADDSNASFVTSSRILSVNMMLGSDSGDREKSNQNFHTIHAALDPMLQGERYQSTAGVESSVTNNLKTQAKIASGSVINEQSGKPLLLVNTNGNEVLLPVSTFEMKTDGTMGANTDGSIYVYNPNGCAVNPTSGCDPTNASKIHFNIGANAKFFPNTITQRVLSDGSREILVGGMAMNNINTTTPTRTPGIGRIVLAANETLESKLQSEDDSTGSCNIQGCYWHPIDESAHPELLDTANITMDTGNPNVAYITTLTKASGEQSQSKVFKALWNGTSFTYTELGSIDGSEEGKVVTAVSDKTLTFKNGKKYFAACTTKKMSQSCNGECVTEQALEDKSTFVNNDFGSSPPPVTNDAMFGQIQLISTTPGDPSILLTEHNYRCGSLVVTNDRSILAAGRLSVQEIPAASINSAVAGNPLPGFMYLDEVASQVNRQNTYADYFLVEPKTFENTSDTQQIGWLTGLTATQFSDGKFVMVNANKYKLEAGYGINTSGTDKEYANAGISMIEFAGMSDRVVASVKTNMENFNASSVSVSYAAAASSKPGMYIPGSFWTSSQGNRTTPTPLPQLSPAMDDSSWFSMYQALITPNQATSSGLDSGMPVFGSHMQQVADCKKTRPSSCM
jgi:prepilin-type N-terminal cleavage/methylation domain-containing protein